MNKLENITTLVPHCSHINKLNLNLKTLTFKFFIKRIQSKTAEKF